MFDDNMTYTLDDFESSKMVLLGEGSYGKVYRAFDQRTGKTVAIKHLIHWGEDDDSKTEQKHFIREISMQSRLKHPCILPFIGFSLPSISENQVTPPFIVTEFMKNGTLQDYANLKNAAKCKSFDWTLRFKAIYGIAAGMAFCHGMEVVHRDLKPENIFLDENLEPKIADFGLARAFGNESVQMSQNTGSPLWMAPEIFNGDDYSTPVDVYSYALIVWQIFTDVLPFTGQRIRGINELAQLVISGTRPSLDKIPENWRPFIESCWASNPSQRPTFKEICEELEKEEYFFKEANHDEIRRFIARTRPSANSPHTSAISADKPEHEQIMDKAEAGDPESQYMYAMMLLQGNNFVQDEERAIQFLIKASSNNYSNADFQLGCLYENGFGKIKTDLVQAARYYKKASDSGNGYGIAAYAKFVRYGLGDVEQNLDLAFQLFSSAAEMNIPKGLVGYGKMLIERGDPSGVEEFNKAVAVTPPEGEAYSEIGQLLEHGKIYHEGQPKPAEAIQYYMQAIKSGYPHANYFVGKIYMEGANDVAKNVSLGIQFFYSGAQYGDIDCRLEYNLALINGLEGAVLADGRPFIPDSLTGISQLKSLAKTYPPAAYQLALIYENGANAIAPNNEAVSKYLIKAKNYGPALAELGRLYKYGLCGFQQNYQESAKYYQKSADLGDGAGLAGYGRCLEQGMGVPQNMEKAISCYKQSAELGNPDGLNHMGRKMCEGALGKVDPQDIIAKFKMAADKDLPTACYNLGYHYMSGKLIPKDLSKARFYFFKAGKLLEEHKDYSQAMKAYKSAGDAGNMDAYVSLGDCYMLYKRDADAKYYYEIAKQNGNLLAVQRLESLGF